MAKVPVTTPRSARAVAKRSATPLDATDVVAFTSAAELRQWLAENHDRSTGIWLRIYKKSATVESVSYAEALDQALCFGWIDGQKRAYDDRSWLQRFTPRRPKSAWSKVNTNHAERLIASGEMTPSGMKAVAAAKQDGRWKSAYDSPRKTAVPEDLLKRLAKNPRAKAFFATLNKANLYAITYRLQTAKKLETRERRMELILEMLASGKKFHP